MWDKIQFILKKHSKIRHWSYQHCFFCFLHLCVLFLIQAKWKFHLIKITVPQWSHQSWTQGPLRVRSSTPKPPSKCLRSILNKILKLRPTQTLPIVSLLHLLIGNQPNTPKLHSRKPLCLITEPAPRSSDTGTRCHRVFFFYYYYFSSAVRRRVQLKVQCWKESSALQVSIWILPPSNRKQWPLAGFRRRFFCGGSVWGKHIC